jgi:hypothetical protein
MDSSLQAILAKQRSLTLLRYTCCAHGTRSVSEQSRKAYGETLASAIPVAETIGTFHVKTSNYVLMTTVVLVGAP